MDFDIGPLLESWEYQPGQIIVRKFIGKDGKEKLQLRVDVGILQMNVEGRPDGKRPMGYSSLYEHLQTRLYQHQAKHAGDDSEFKLDAADCGKLQFECMQYHQRAFCLLQLEEYAGVIRDAVRNQAIFDFVRKYAGPEFATPFLHMLPQQILVLTRARAALSIAASDYDEAIRHIEQGIEQIRSLIREHDSRPEAAEQCGELQWLEAWLTEVASQRPLTRREELQRELDEAIRTEDYEKAARVRDELLKLKA